MDPLARECQLEGNEIAHRLSVEGMCLNGLWALKRASFATLDHMVWDSDEVPQSVGGGELDGPLGSDIARQR